MLEYDMNFEHIYSQLNVDKETITKFFFFFSRFEYALKRAGYLQNGQKAKPDWDKFTKDNESNFDPKKTKTLRDACEYLLKKPPKEQVVQKGKLDFNVPTEFKNMSRFGKAVLAVKTVRNNLFHGGKYSNGPLSDPARDSELIKNCVILLEEMLELAPKVAKEFNADPV
ncbi:MAG: hypothetical protein ACE5NM_12715 [Sedimentisphaerales bacterium]